MVKRRTDVIPPCTDAGNAELFASRYQDVLRFDHRRKRWLFWNKHWWQEDSDGLVMQRAKQAARYRFRLSGEIRNDDPRRDRERKWAVNSESRARLEAALAIAQSEWPLADPGTNWDTD